MHHIKTDGDQLKEIIDQIMESAKADIKTEIDLILGDTEH